MNIIEASLLKSESLSVRLFIFLSIDLIFLSSDAINFLLSTELTLYAALKLSISFNEYIISDTVTS